MTNTSPFKFLDSYKQSDRDVFFGRDKDIDALYHSLSGVKHLLVYGPSGAGKTSLIECGLRNQFSDADWFALTVRRGTDINQSFFTTVNGALQEKVVLSPDTKLPIDDSINFGQAVEMLFAERYQPIYLLFDQFEELLILGEEEEKKSFFQRLNQLVRYRVPCRVLLIMREEFIGHLSEFETECPTIFQYRLRLEKMRRSAMPDVISQILQAERYKPFFEVENGEKLCELIYSKLPDNRNEIELAHLQVFLDELWDRANANQKDNKLPVLHPGLIKKKDDLESVLDIFLKKQFASLEPLYGKGVPLELLTTMISDKNTKVQRSEKEIEKELSDAKVVVHGPLNKLMEDLESRRIIRPLKAAETTQYEISHDILALLVGQNRTTEMKKREEAQATYEIYEKKPGTYSLEDLDFLRSYEKDWPYSPALQERIKQSEFHLSNQQKQQLEKAVKEAETERNRAEEQIALRKEADASKNRARKNFKVAMGVALVAVLLAIFASISYRWADNETANAIEARTIADHAKATADTALKNEKMQQKVNEALQLKLFGDNYKLLDQTNYAKENYQAAFKLLSSYKDNSLYQELEKIVTDSLR